MRRSLTQLVITTLALAALGIACNPSKEMKTTGTIERLDPALDSIISPDAIIEIVAKGFDWTEGPVWIDKEKMLLFSDIPQNKVFKWTEQKGAEVYLTPSGYTGAATRGGEMGSNGLLLNGDGKLVLCQHGDRRIAIMNAPLNAPKADFTTLADSYDGKKFNSPNDAVFRNGDLYFTDPPYGLEKQTEDPAKELPFQGVYHCSSVGVVTLLIDSLTRPNGIAFSPDGKYLFVANSDTKMARWHRYNFNEDKVSEEEPLFALGEGKILYDATSLTATEKGLPDGMKIDSKGTIFATGPGGVFIMNLDGKQLGKIKIPDPTSNCALSDDEKTLFVTNDMYLLRIKMRN